MPNNLSDTLTRQINKGKFNLKNDPSNGLKFFKRNIKNIISLCKSNGTKVIISTFCFHLYDSIKNDEIHLRYKEIVEKENKIISNCNRGKSFTY